MVGVDTEALWERFHGELRAFLLRRVDSEVVADDLLQSAFLRAHRSLASGDAPEQPRAWLYRIARNLLVDAGRHAQRRRVATDAALADPTTVSEPDPAGDDAFAVVARTLPLFLAELEAPYREALEMVELEGLTQAEAATRAGVSLSGMKSRVQRGRRRVYDALRECCELEVDARGHLVGCTVRSPDRDCC